MKAVKKLKVFCAVMMALAMIFGSIPASVANTVNAADPSYYVAVYTTTTAYYTATMVAAGTANVPKETQSVYFAISSDGQNYQYLNSNSGVIFAQEESMKLVSPRIVKDGDTFKVYALDADNSSKVHVFTSTDGVHYYTETVSTDAGDLAVVNDTDALNADSVQGFPEDKNLSLGNAIEITKAEYDYFNNKLGTVENTGLEAVKALNTTAGAAITEEQLAKEIPSVNATYTDGSTQSFNIDWSGALKNVDFNKAGTYTISGKVIQTQYINKLKELNNSEAKDDDPDNASPVDSEGNAIFPDNYDTESGTVYYDSTKYIEGLADPEIYYDEQTGYYYCTGSYFPSAAEKNSASDSPYYGAKSYDRVTLRRSKTLEGLQSREGQVTIWKAGNQNWYKTMSDAEAEKDGKKGYRYIWAPEIHRVGNYWVVYFTESESSSNLYGIQSHCLVLDGSMDPYDTALSEPNEVSQWIDLQMQPREGDTSTQNRSETYEKPFTSTFNLDMTYFEDASTGTPYVIYAGKPTIAKGGSSTDLFIAQVDKENPNTLASDVTRLTWSRYGWEEISYYVNEGPTVVQHNGDVFLCFSVSGTGSEYAIGMLSAKCGEDLLDRANWVKNPYPLLTSKDVNGEEGPGHNSFTVDEDGNVIFVYHARPTSHNYKMCGSYGSALEDPCRHARLKRVHWSADGTPILKMTYDEELKEEFKTVSTTVTVKSAAPTVVKVSSVTVTPKSKTLYVGNTVALSASVAPANATSKTLKYTSDKPAVASVDASGKVTAKKKGTANITVAAQDGSGASATVKITVKEGTLSVSGKTSVKVKKKISLTAKAKNLNSTKITWKVTKGAKYVKLSKTSGKTIKVTGKKKGTVKIKVTCGYKSVTKTIKVKK